MKRCLFIVTILVLCLSSVTSFAATGGYLGINDYTSWSGDCSWGGDRAGATYVGNLKNQVSSTFTTQYYNTNSSVVEYNVRNAGTVDLFAYSGHTGSRTLENLIHCFARTGGPTWHDSTMELNSNVNATTTECNFSHKYIFMYTCHWLENNGNSTKLSNIWNTFDGARMTLGFASTMFLDSREGTVTGQYLNQGYTYQNAFRTSALYYQTQRVSGDTIVRAQGHTSCKTDTLTSSYSGNVPSYASSPSSFSVYYTETVPHNGIPR